MVVKEATLWVVPMGTVARVAMASMGETGGMVEPVRDQGPAATVVAVAATVMVVAEAPEVTTEGREAAGEMVATMETAETAVPEGRAEEMVVRVAMVGRTATEVTEVTVAQAEEAVGTAATAAREPAAMVATAAMVVSEGAAAEAAEVPTEQPMWEVQGGQAVQVIQRVLEEWGATGRTEQMVATAVPVVPIPVGSAAPVETVVAQLVLQPGSQVREGPVAKG